MYALIYTRSCYVDYQYFAGPPELRADHEVNVHIRNVMHEDDGGTVGDLIGKRWHVFRKGRWLIIGMATKEYGRVDETGTRQIRGYYGFVMPIECAKVPSKLLYDEIDKRFVQSVFMDASISPSDGLIEGGIFDDEMQYSQPFDVDRWVFNTDTTKVRFHVCNNDDDDIDTLLRSAVAYAVKVDKFEIVIGLNTIAHATRLPICNCMCKAVVTSQDHVLKAGCGTDVNQQRFGIEIGRCGGKSVIGVGAPRENSLGSGVRNRQSCQLDQEPGGLWGMRRTRSSLDRSNNGIMKTSRRIVIDLKNENEKDPGFWREFLSVVNKFLSLIGINARCQIEEKNALTQTKSVLAAGKQVADEQVARNYLESGF